MNGVRPTTTRQSRAQPLTGATVCSLALDFVALAIRPESGEGCGYRMWSSDSAGARTGEPTCAGHGVYGV